MGFLNVLTYYIELYFLSFSYSLIADVTGGVLPIIIIICVFSKVLQIGKV